MRLLNWLFGGQKSKEAEPVAVRPGEYVYHSDRVGTRLRRKIVSILRRSEFSDSEKRMKILKTLKAKGRYLSEIKEGDLRFCDCGYPLGGYLKLRGRGGWVRPCYTSFDSILIHIDLEGDPWGARTEQVRCPNCGTTHGGTYVDPSR